jgi:hypothetical protein
MDKNINNAMSCSVAIEDRIKWTRATFVEDCFKELAILFAKTHELSEHGGVLLPLDYNIIDCMRPVYSIPLDEQVSIQEAVEQGEDGNIVINLSTKEQRMGGNSYTLEKTIIKAVSLNEMCEYLHLEKGETYPVSISIPAPNH